MEKKKYYQKIGPKRPGIGVAPPKGQPNQTVEAMKQACRDVRIIFTPAEQAILHSITEGPNGYE